MASNEVDETKSIKLFKTVLLGIAHFCNGATYSAVYATLPELAKIYKVSSSTISLLFVPQNFGCLVVSLLLGGVHLNNPYWTFLFMLASLSLLLPLYPALFSIYFLFLMEFFSGMLHQMLWASGNVECMELWKDSSSEPFLHFITLCFSIGMFFSPAIASELLPGEAGTPNLVLVNGSPGLNTFYYIVSIVTIMSLPPFAHMARKHGKEFENKLRQSKRDTKIPYQLRSLIAMFVLLYFMLSIFIVMGSMLPIFGVESHLHLSSAKSAQLSSIYLGSTIFTKAMAIILSTRMISRKTIHFFMVMIFLPTIYISCRGNSLSLLELQASITVIGLGAGPMFSMTMIFFEEFAPVNLTVSSLLLLGHTIGQNFWPPLLTPFIEKHPFLLFWISTFNSGLCLLCFGGLALFMSLIKTAITFEEDNAIGLIETAEIK